MVRQAYGEMAALQWAPFSNRKLSDMACVVSKYRGRMVTQYLGASRLLAGHMTHAVIYRMTDRVLVMNGGSFHMIDRILMPCLSRVDLAIFPAVARKRC